MSFDLSWAAFHSVPKSEVLRAAGLVDTGVPDEGPEGPFSCAVLPTGWTLLMANDSTYTFTNIVNLSRNHAVLSVIVQEYVPLSMASYHVRGEQFWQVFHDAQRGPLHLDLTGAVPPEAAAIRDRILATTPRGDGVDYLYDAPLDLALSIVGYRHDRWRFDWGQPAFTVAEVGPKG